MVPCRQCDTPVAENATICPTCGAPNPAQRYGPAGGIPLTTAAVAGGTGREVVITGVKIPFLDLVLLILKVMLASIPAYILMFILFLMMAGVMGGFMAAMMPDAFNEAMQGGAGVETEAP